MKIFFILIVVSSSVLFFGCEDSKVVNTPGLTEVSAPAALTAVTEKIENIEVKLDAPAFGAVDGINDVISPAPGSTISIDGEKIVIAGNFVDAIKGDVASGVVVLIDDKKFLAIYGGDRPDIAQALNNPKYIKCQFYVEIPTASVGVGVHDLRIRVVAADRSGYYESALIAKLDVK